MHGSGWTEVFFIAICIAISIFCGVGFVLGFTYGKGIAKGKEND